MARALVGMVTLAVAVIALASAAGALSPTPPPSCPTGADQWQGGATGKWETPGNWSKGIPGASDYACITTAAAAVTVNSTDTIAGLLLGTGDSLDIQTEGLTLSGTSTPSALQGSLTIAKEATFTVGSAATLLNATSGSITSPGAVDVAGVFEQDEGTVASAAGDNPVVLQTGSSLKLAGTGAAAFQAASLGNVSLAGNLASGQSLEIPVSAVGETDVTTVTAAGSFTNAGTITIDHASENEYGEGDLDLPSGDMLTNTGTIDVSGQGVGSNVSEGEHDNIDGSVDNQGTLNVGVSGLPVAYLVLGAGTKLTNTGKVSVASGSTLVAAAASTGAQAQPAAAVENSSGSIVNAGTFVANGSFTQGSGAVSGDEVTLGNGSVLTFAGTGAAAFQAASLGSLSLAGNLASGQSLEIPVSAVGETDVTTVTAAGSFTNAGTITMDKATDQPYGEADLDLPSGDLLTNTGTIDVSGQGYGSNSAEGEHDNIDGSIDNQGTLNVGVSGLPVAYLVLGAGTKLTNTGKVNVTTGSTLVAAAATTGAKAQPAAAVENSSGTISNEGAITANGPFTQGSGPVSGDLVKLGDDSTLTFAGTGAAAFQAASLGSLSLAGNLASGQSLEIPVSAVGETDVTTVTAAGSFTNAGTITIDKAVGSAYGEGDLDLPSGDTLTNTGTIDVSGQGYGGNDAEGEHENINGSIDNQGTLNVGGSGLPIAYLVLPAGTKLTNTGKVNVTTGSTLVAAAATTGAQAQPAAAVESSSGTITDAGTIMAHGPFENQGTLNVGVSGQALAYLTLAAGSNLTNKGTLNVGASGGPASLGVAAGATMTTTGTIDLASGSTLTSAGRITAESGTIAVDGTFSSSDGFDFQGGAVTGGPIAVSAGQMLIQSTGSISLLVPAGGDPSMTGNIAAGQSLEIDDVGGVAGGTIVSATAPLTNAGTITLLANEYAEHPAELTGGTSLLTNTGTISFQTTASGGGEIDMPIRNEASGTIDVTEGGADRVNGRLTNDGTLSVQWGTLELSGGLSNIGETSTLSGGAYRVLGSAEKPATLAIPGVTTVNTLAGALEVGPDASFIEPSSKASNFSIATIAKTGSLTLDGGATDAPTASSLSNEGALTLQPKAQLKVDSYTQKTSGSLIDEVAGAPSSDEFGTIAATGSVALAGALSIKGDHGFTPASGDAYTAIAGAALTGTFEHFNATTVPGGLVYTAAYTPTSVQFDVGPGVDLAASSVSAPSVAKVGQSVTVGWKVTAGGKEVTGDWSDAVYLSQSASASSGAVLVGTVAHTGGLGAGDSYDGSLTATVPGVLPGSWHFVVVADVRGQTADIDRANNTAASPALQVSQNVLAVGSSVSGTIPAGGDVYVQVDPSAGTNLKLTATFAESATGAMYEAFGRVPGPEGYDQAPTSTSSEVQELTIADTQSGAYYVDLNNPTSSAQPYTLAAAAPTLAVSSVTPSTSSFLYEEVFTCGGICAIGERSFGTPKPIAATQQDLTVTINGSGFTRESAVSLSCTGLSAPSPAATGQFPASAVTFVNSSELYADFGPLFSPTGICTVSVTSAGHTGQLAGAITFKSTTILDYKESGEYLGEHLNALPAPDSPEVSVAAPSVNRPKTDSEVVVNYSNPHPYEIPAPLMELDATGATLHFPDQPAGDGSSLPILGTAPTGDPGVLAPHASGSVEVLFDSTLGGHEVVSFSVGVIENSSDTLDFGGLLASILPAKTAPAILEYVKAQGGTVTAGQLQSTLDADATYLSTLGEPLPDTEGLFVYELNKVTDYGQLLERHIGGPFGAGTPGLVDSLTVDAQGNVAVAEPSGNIAEFAALPSGGYDSPPGAGSSLAAGGGGEGWVITQRDGATDTFNGSGQLVSSADSYGNVTTYTYTGGNLTSISKPNGDLVTYTYNGADEVSSSSDSASGQNTSYTYDSTGHLAGVSTGGITETLTWNASSNIALDGTLATKTEGDGVTDSYSYDSQGRLTTVRRSDGTTLQSLAYPTSATVEITDAEGKETTDDLDATGAVARAVLPDGTESSTSRNAQGEPVAETIADTSELLGYNGEGELTSAVNPLGQKTSLAYAPSGTLSGFTEPAGPATTLESNAQGSPTAVVSPDGDATEIAYTPTGQIASETDRDASKLNFTYDAAGDLTSETLPGGGVEAFGYDSDHNLTSASDSAGTTSFTYDADSRITGVTYPTGLGISFTYDSAGRRASETTSDGYTLNYHYDSAGRLESLTDSSGASIVSYAYTPDDQPATITNGNGTSTHYTYDSRGEVASVVNEAPGGAVTSKFEYAHNELGETTSVTSAAGTTSYVYDAAGELVKAVLPGGRTLTYSYDADGNRTATSDSSSGSTAYQVNGEDEYTSAGATTYTYDADGNLATATDGSGTTTYHWDAEGRLESVIGLSGTTSYTYDALGTLIAEDVNGTTTDMLSDPGDETLLGQYSAVGAPIAHYPAGLGVVGQADSSGATSYYGFDASGNVVSLSDPAGAVSDSYQYLPFGTRSTTSGTEATAFGFAGQFGITTDPATGFTQNGVRDYDPGTGRFISQDTTLLSAANPYEYAANDPIDKVDVTGHEEEYDVNIGENFEPGRLRQSEYEKMTPHQRLIYNSTKRANEEKAGRADNDEQDNFDSPLGFLWNYPKHPNIWGPRAKDLSTTNTSHDPNEIVGPAGFGAAGFLRGHTPLPYRVNFTNLASASLPAATVKVTEPLDPNVDLSTFSLGSFGFAHHIVTPSAGLRSYQTTIDDTAVSGLDVDVKAALDTTTRTVTWTFTSIDPATGLPPTDASAGFLPPDATSPEGEGFVSYDVTPTATSPTGTVVAANATVQFDTNAPISTPTVSNTIDVGTPTATVNPLPATESGPFTVTWSGSEEPGGAGIADYDVLVSKDGGPFEPLAIDTTETSTLFMGEVGHSYAFIASAIGNVGNAQPQPTELQAETAVVEGSSVLPGPPGGTPGTEGAKGTTTTTGSTGASGSTGSTASGASSPQKTEATLDGQRITLTTPSPLTCTAAAGKLAVTLAAATAPSSKGAKLKLANVAFYIDKGVEHKTVRGHGAKQKIAITYVANATAHRLPAALELSLAGLKSGAHTLKVTISYTEASNKHGHKASTLTKTLQAKFTVC